jgi:hypothetical protein
LLLSIASALLLTASLPAAPAPPTSLMHSEFVLASTGITDPPDPNRERSKKPRKPPKHPQAVVNNEGLGPERARILLQSLTVPGWGQATLGRKGAARTFQVAEAGIWSMFIAFKVQQSLRTEAYLKTAELGAGTDLRNRDDEFRRIVGAFASSDEYNLLVVARDAANLYLSDPANPDLAGYRAYIAKHSLSGSLTWRWADETAFLRYGSQRKFAQKAGLRANTALGLAIANRLMSALHAARAAGQSPVRTGWRLDVRPGLDDTGQLRAALSTQF